MAHPQRDTQADRQLLVGKLPPPIRMHASQVFLDAERHRMSFVHVMHNCWCVYIYTHIFVYLYILYMYIHMYVCVCVCVYIYIIIIFAEHT